MFRTFASDDVKRPVEIPAPWGTIISTFVYDEIWEIGFNTESPKQSSSPFSAESFWIEAIRSTLSGISLDEEVLESLFRTRRWKGLSAFSQKVLQFIATIPCGQFRTYREIASEIGMTGASQAVGQVLAHNPFPILIPCHRIVSKEMLEKMDITNPKTFEGSSFRGSHAFAPIGAWLRLNDLAHS